MRFACRPLSRLQQRRFSIESRPVLRQLKTDGYEEDITEDELFCYTRYRCNEDEQLSRRYRKFKLDALLKVAIDAVGEGARNCTKIVKCLEGQYNKAYVLTVDTGREVVAKLPNPNAGPGFLLTASEVATRTFLHEKLCIPTPAIHAWCSDPHNAVSAEYIIEDKADGVPLGTLWSNLSRHEQSNILSQVVDIEARLASISFPKYGCLYFKKDLEKSGIIAESLFATSDTRQDPLELSEYALGPLTSAQHWEAERAQLKLDRGPWSCDLDYIRAIGVNEAQWTRFAARPRINYYRSTTTQASPEEYLELINKFLAVAASLQPPDSGFMYRKTLSHNDLHLDNIFVNPQTSQVTCIIDWQSTSISALFRQSIVPRMIEMTSTEDDEGVLSYLPSDALNHQDTDTYLIALYQELCRQRNPYKRKTHKDTTIPLRTKPVELITGAWAREDVFSFRHALLNVAAHWKDLGIGECPISFMEEELKAHEAEMELLDGLRSILHQLHDEGLIPLGGMVPREKFETAQTVNEFYKNAFTDLGENEEQKDLHSRVWPYQNSRIETQTKTLSETG